MQTRSLDFRGYPLRQMSKPVTYSRTKSAQSLFIGDVIDSSYCFSTREYTAFMLPKTGGKVDIMKSISQFIVLKCGYYPLLAPQWIPKVHRRCNFGLNYDQGILNRRYIMTV